MTDPSPDLSPVRFAALVAPAVTRVFVTGMRSPGHAARELIMSYGGRQSIGYVIDLRHPLLAGRPVSREDVGVVYRYHSPERIEDTVAQAVAADLLARDDGGALVATARGRKFLEELTALQASSLATRWGPDGDQTGVETHAERIDRLNARLARVLAEAERTAGAAWAVQSPPYEPDGLSPALVLTNRLSTMRYHRADAHAAAWQEAGMGPADAVAQPTGDQWTPQRRAVEQRTNELDAAPWAVLTAEERLTLLADLAALP